MNSLNLGGHSGCGVFLMETESGQVFVRKISKDPMYNARLQAQCSKQKEFSGRNLKTPAVLAEGLDESGCYYFDMEYVQGVTLAEYIKTMEISKVRGLVQTVVEDLVPENIEVNSCQKESIQRIFSEKLDSLESNLADYPQAMKALKLLRQHDWRCVAVTQCHGDLTLENIIVRNDRLYLIDFLDSFYNSWILDMGTLLQDVQVMWSYRKGKPVSVNTVLRLMVFRDLLLDTVREIEPNYVQEIYYSLLMKLVRIYPYTKDQLTLDFLDEKVEQVMKCIDVIKGEDKP